MTNELVKTENHYFILCDVLLNKVAEKHPADLQETKRFLCHLETFNVYEKTLYVAELLESLTSMEQATHLNDIEQLLKKNNITSSVITLLQKYSAWIK